MSMDLPIGEAVVLGRREGGLTFHHFLLLDNEKVKVFKNEKLDLFRD